ncbi:MAG: F0F1 ATP synthase subunit B [Planctomycetes bacterium]|nr:F0F1 ATP synthase subunit B [Planctomycetota bacterium]
MDTFLQMMGAQWQVILILTISFIFLVLVLSKFLFKPVLKYLDERNNEIKETYQGIEKSKEEISTLKDKYQAELKKIEKTAYDKMQEAIKEGLAAKTEIISEAHAQADKILQKAAEEIAQETKKALVELKKEVVNLSFQTTAKIIGNTMDEKIHHQLAEKFMDEIPGKK